MQRYKRVLTIAGSDSGAGAGIQADIKTISALNCYASTAITTITSQNTQNITEIFNLPFQTIISQIKAVLDDIGTNAVKIGMLPDNIGIKAIANILQEYNTPNIVLDTIMISSSGKTILSEEALDSLKTNLIPISHLITPNIPEAEVLINMKISTKEEIIYALKALQQLGCDNVLLKGGHQIGKTCTDYLLEANGTIHQFTHDRIESKNTHGTGCTLSSAISAYLAQNESISEACRKAGIYVNKAIIKGKDFVLGKGNGPLYHFVN